MINMMLVASSCTREFSLIQNLFCKHLRHFINAQKNSLNSHDQLMLVASSRAREFSLILSLFCKHLRHFIHRLVISFIRISPKLSEASNKVDLKKPAQCQINVNDFVWGLVLAGELASTGTLGRLDLASTEGF